MADSSGGFRIEVLGPVEARVDGRPVALGGERPRALVAVLALMGGRVVSSDRLIDELWGDDPPARARDSVQMHVSRLRKALAEAGAGEGRVVSRAGGYLLNVQSGECDVDRWQQALADARRAREAGELQVAREAIEDALGVWRGEPLGGVTSTSWLAGERARLEEQRLSAIIEGIELDLELGRHGESPGQLDALVVAHPFNERLVELQMLALYRSGRQADALAAFRAARDRFVEELGIEPSQQLRALHEDVLKHSAELASPIETSMARRALAARELVLPAGTVTLLFTDIEGSMRLLERLGEDYAELLDAHRGIVRGALAAHGGQEISTEGDAFFAAFTRAGDAVRAAVAAQRGLAACAWSGGVEVRVRMALHTGEPQVVGGDYVGMDVHCAARICSAAHGGQVVVSQTTERVLSGRAVEGVELRDLGEYRLKDLTDPLRLYQVVADGLVTDFPPLRALERRPRNLPGQWTAPTVLFGREADLEGLARLLRELKTRLVTLVGPGGVGKTRLALEAARRLAGDFADGAQFVGLAAVLEPRELASAIARALAAPIRADESSRAALVRFLGDRHMLLVLDNLEQLIEGAPLVGELLAACPGVTIVVTSREPTRLAAERLYPVRPLEVPVDSGTASALELERFGAVAMFCDRARARDPDFALDTASAPHVRNICRRLDGLPLSLELAAARIGLLSPAELATRLDDALAVLVGGARDAPQRQRTLRATIDWSYRLLTREERQAFARMAVFAGGATVAAAEIVTGASLDTLDSLAAKQLLAHRDDRLLMLETVREYALELLAADRETEDVYERLAGWCLTFAREATPHLPKADRVTWLARLDAELPNILTALSWALEQRRGELALQLVIECGDYWWYTNRWQEGHAWCQAALDSAPCGSDHARAGALLFRARLTDTRRLYQQERDDLESSLGLFRTCDDAAGIAACLGHLAFLEAWRGRFERATALGDEAIGFAERAQDKDVLATALSMSAIAVAKYEDAAPRASAAITHLRAVGDLNGLSRVCANLGYLATAQRRYQDALGWLEQGIGAARQLQDSFDVFMLQTNEALAMLFLDELDDAARAFRDGLAICREAGADQMVDETLLGLAATEALRGDLQLAARLAGTAQGHETAERSIDEDTIRSRLQDEILTPARKRLGPERWDEAAREGAVLTVHDAIDLALARGRFAATAPG